MARFLARLHRSSGSAAIFVRFAGVGVTISIIDVTGLYLLMAFGINAYVARIFSYTLSMTAGYFLNRYFTFHHIEIDRRLWSSLLRHYSVISIGGIINFAIFSVVLLAGQAMGGEVAASAILPLIGVWIGGMTGLCFNFFFSKKLVFTN